MLKMLGPTSEVVRRREERILHLRKLDQKLAEVNALIVNHVGKSEAAASDLCHTTSTSPALPGDWANDKDIWLSGSSLDLHQEDKNGHSVDNKYLYIFIHRRFLLTNCPAPVCSTH